MHSFEVRQNGRILFVVVARSLKRARQIVESRLSDTVAVEIVRCKR